jgi:hypothetical protein
LIDINDQHAELGRRGHWREQQNQTMPAPPMVTDAVNSNADISVLLKDGRLEIAATVDANGLKTLKEMLGRYEGILDLLKPKPQ